MAHPPPKKKNQIQVYLEWVGLSAAEMIMVAFLLSYGCQLLSRIRAAVVFDSRNRRSMIFRLNAVLVIMVLVLLVEITARWVMLMPYYLRGWDDMQPKPYIFMLLSQNPVRACHRAMRGTRCVRHAAVTRERESERLPRNFTTHVLKVRACFD